MDQQFPNLRHLRVCLEVSKTNSITVASQQAHLSQPAISQAIAKLEQMLGIALFVRLPKGVYPTDLGKLFLERAERALAFLEQGASLALRARLRKNGKRHDQFDRFLTAAQLRALVSIYRSNNFSIAARNVGISQPSLHRAARDLEKLAGIRLFIASKQGVELTIPATILAKYAMLAASELRHARSEIHSALELEPSKIFVGTLPLARSNILPAGIDIFMAENKAVQIQVLDGPYGEQLTRLRQGEIDFMIGALREQAPADDVIQETLFVDTLAIVVRNGHPLALRVDISLEDLLGFPWVAPPKDTPTGRYLFEKLGIAEMQATPVRVVSSSLLLVRSLLLRGDYITIISAHQIRHEIEHGILKRVQIDIADSERKIGLTYRHEWHPTSVQKRFLDIIRIVSSRA